MRNRQTEQEDEHIPALACSVRAPGRSHLSPTSPEPRLLACAAQQKAQTLRYWPYRDHIEIVSGQQCLDCIGIAIGTYRVYRGSVAGARRDCTKTVRGSCRHCAGTVSGSYRGRIGSRSFRGHAGMVPRSVEGVVPRSIGEVSESYRDRLGAVSGSYRNHAGLRRGAYRGYARTTGAGNEGGAGGGQQRPETDHAVPPIPALDMTGLRHRTETSNAAGRRRPQRRGRRHGGLPQCPWAERLARGLRARGSRATGLAPRGATARRDVQRCKKEGRELRPKVASKPSPLKQRTLLNLCVSFLHPNILCIVPMKSEDLCRASLPQHTQTHKKRRDASYTSVTG